MKNAIIYAVSRTLDNHERYQDQGCHILKTLKGEVYFEEPGSRRDLLESGGYYTLGYFDGSFGRKQLTSKDRPRLHLIDAVYEGNIAKFDFYLRHVYTPSLRQNPGSVLELITYIAATQNDASFMEKLLNKEKVQIHPDALIVAAETGNKAVLKLLLKRCLGLDGKSPQYVNGETPKFPNMTIINGLCGDDLRAAYANVPYKELKACLRVVSATAFVAGSITMLGTTTCLIGLAAFPLGYAFLGEPTKVALKYTLETDLSVLFKCINTKTHAEQVRAGAHANNGYGGSVAAQRGGESPSYAAAAEHRGYFDPLLG